MVELLPQLEPCAKAKLVVPGTLASRFTNDKSHNQHVPYIYEEHVHEKDPIL